MGLKILTAKENDSGQRTDKFLLKTFPKLTKSGMYKAIRKKDIKINGKKIAGNEIIQSGDQIRIYLPDDILNFDKNKEIIYSEKNADIIFEDKNIISIYKPVGVETVPSKNGDNTSAVSMLWKALDIKKQNESSFRPAFVSRLDRNTDGILTAAKNAASLRDLSELVRKHEYKKYYICAVCGKFEKKSGKIFRYISDSKNGKVSVSKNPQPQFRNSETGYEVIAENGDLSLLKIRLYTGRKHQIRAVMQSIGHPVLGCPKYGDRIMNKKYNIKYQMLTAYAVAFDPEDKNNSLYYLKGQKICLPEKYLKKYNDIFKI